MKRIMAVILVLFSSELLAVVPRSIPTGGTTIPRLHNDLLLLGRFERFAVIPGAVGAGGAAVSLAGDGGLGCG